MKTLTKLALAALMLTSAIAAQAGWVNGYTRNDGTYVSGHYGTSRHYGNTAYHNLYGSDDGSSYGTSRSYGNTTYQNSYDSDGGSLSGTSRSYGNTTYHNYYGSDGSMITGTTRTYGNTSYTTLNDW
jgi:hypothetical protein